MGCKRIIGRQGLAASIPVRTCISSRNCRYGSREVGGGRSTRQPGQVRKEAALTSPERVIVPASHLFANRFLKAAAKLTALCGAGDTHLSGIGRVQLASGAN